MVLHIQHANGSQTTIPLKMGTLTLGRDPACDLTLDDALVSGFHCDLEIDASGAFVIDRQSRNRSYINGSPITSGRLSFGDSLVVGRTRLTICKDIPEPWQKSSTTIPVHAAFSAEQGTGKPTSGTDLEQENQRLRILYRMSTELSVENHRDPLLDRIWTACSQAVHSSCGALLLRNARGEMEVQRWNGGNREPLVSSSLIQRMEQEVIGLLLSNVQTEPDLANAVSIAELHASSCLCCPLLGTETMIGAIQLIRRIPESPFNQQDLEFLTAFCNLAGRLLNEVMYREEMQLQQRKLQILLEQPTSKFPMIGVSPVFLKVLEEVKRVSCVREPVLLLGATGTGKDHIAPLIHELSPYRNGPFQIVDASTIPPNLFESILFGHEEGAFTGAVSSAPGRIEMARGGTLYLDEIGELPIHLQAKLLRVIETKSFQRVGGTKLLHADFRLIASTNRDLRRDIAEDEFRQDLFFRMSTFLIRLPELKQRPEDIPLLVEYFLQQIRHEAGSFGAGRAVRFEKPAILFLQNYHWPGNIRQLRNLVRRFAARPERSVITLSQVREYLRSYESDLAVIGHAPPAGEAGYPDSMYLEYMNAMEARYWRNLQDRAGGTYSDMAVLSGVSRYKVSRHIRRLRDLGLL